MCLRGVGKKFMTESTKIFPHAHRTLMVTCNYFLYFDMVLEFVRTKYCRLILSRGSTVGVVQTEMSAWYNAVGIDASNLSAWYNTVEIDALEHVCVVLHL